VAIIDGCLEAKDGIKRTVTVKKASYVRDLKRTSGCAQFRTIQSQHCREQSNFL